MKIGYAICDFETTGLDVEVDYPIEVGLILTAPDLSAVAIVDELILWDEAMNRASLQDIPYRVHGITPQEILDKGERYTDVAATIELAVNSTKRKHKLDRIILFSDNAQFEDKFMRKLLCAGAVPWPFHYCTWDSSAFLVAAGVGDPIPEHRAFRDAALLHKALIEANAIVKSKGLPGL